MAVVSKKAPKTGPKPMPKTTKPAKPSKDTAKPAKAAPKAKGKASAPKLGRPFGTKKREIKGIQVFQSFPFDRVGAKELVGGLRRVVIEAGPDGSKQLEKLVKLVEKNDKKLRDLIG